MFNADDNSLINANHDGFEHDDNGTTLTADGNDDDDDDDYDDSKTITQVQKLKAISYFFKMLLINT